MFYRTYIFRIYNECLAANKEVRLVPQLSSYFNN